ncbi:transposase [Streptomyces sp. NBC_01619]|nr:transposase [Streptomyces sp. NBC_01619]
MPGIGEITGARVLAEFGDDPTRYSSAKARKNYAGTSPVTRASGKSHNVQARYVRNNRLADALQRQAFSAYAHRPAPAATTTSSAPGKPATTPRSARSVTGSSASSTVASRPAPTTTKRPPGRTTRNPMPLDLKRHGVSDQCAGSVIIALTCASSTRTARSSWWTCRMCALRSARRCQACSTLPVQIRVHSSGSGALSGSLLCRCLDEEGQVGGDGRQMWHGPDLALGEQRGEPGAEPTVTVSV